MKVGLLSPGWPRSAFANGIVSSVECLIEPLQAAGIEPCVLAWEGQAGSAHEFVRVIAPLEPSRGLGRLPNKLRWSLAPGRTARASFVRRFDADVMRAGRSLDVIESEESFGWTAGLDKRTRPALVLTLHGPWLVHGSFAGQSAIAGPFRDRVRAEGNGLRRADLLIAPSRDVLDKSRHYYRLDGLPTVVIPYAMPVQAREARWKLEECSLDDLLFVGRFDRHKGGDTVIDAFAQAAQKLPSLRLTFAGPDRGLQDREGRAWSLPAFVEHRLPGAVERGQVRLLGQCTPAQLEPLRLKALATLSCSRWENLSLAAMEALATGCPLIAADRGGISEHIQHGRNGMLFEAGNAERLAECILKLRRDPARAAVMGSAAADTVQEQFDPYRIALRRVDAYRRALAARDGGSSS